VDKVVEIKVTQECMDGDIFHRAIIICDGEPCTERFVNHNYVKKFSAKTAAEAKLKAEQYYAGCKGECHRDKPEFVEVMGG
jgi:hypothetical protein